MITIHLNEKPLEVDKNINISNLLRHINYPEVGIAVAINQEIISKSNWSKQSLNSGDKVLIIQATQGG
ncbi:sulfur carrier protein ThiS [Gaetbulibacter saemankumensis]|uniref:sulfur carrier protein ThiS n=1 Tax=Gaetbulibacter saemankumensis TaxID=311208 RepID=UPI000420A78D|nr:sulfur carrier protein ThiS [Gaetbulibacter saemankumensis]